MLLIEIFNLSPNMPITRIPCAEDPRGYVELLGNDLDREYNWGQRNMIISGVVEFESHVSFTLNRTYNIILSTSETGLDCLVIKTDADEILEENSFKNCKEMYQHLASKFSTNKAAGGKAK